MPPVERGFELERGAVPPVDSGFDEGGAVPLGLLLGWTGLTGVDE